MAIDKTLCNLEKAGFVATQFKDYKKLVRYGEYVCQDCGRVARKKINLCNPKRLYPKDKVVK
ncbi:MAG: hypothetical protein MUO62_07760 [Anaerolineales bacterium]|nr:hypothetical protein [Anaerolineales bacterium]